MSHYFDPAPPASSARRPLSARARGRTFAVEVDTGVFSGERLDPGTAVLLQRAPAPAAQGNLLDLGCGWGPIALTLASESAQAQVWAVDVNQRALDLTAANAARAGLKVHAVTAQEVPPEIQFETIWSNPPIRIGKAALHQLLQTWLNRLTPTGTAILVVNRNLGSDSLQRWLQEQGWFAQRLESRRGYRLLEVKPAETA